VGCWRRDEDEFRVRIERVRPGEGLSALGEYHYAAGEPSACVHGLGAYVRGELVGVLCVSMPVLNASWRGVAWPGLFDGCDGLRERARRLNAEVRVISRVIVDPRARGLSIASGLVRAYLGGALTARTEAVAAMGRVVPFFERGGMRRVEVEMSERTRRVARALRVAGVRWQAMLDVGVAGRVLRRNAGLRREVERWALSSKSTRRHWEGGGEDWGVWGAWASSQSVSAPGVYVVP
jgi:hypothetical protein